MVSLKSHSRPQHTFRAYFKRNYDMYLLLVPGLVYAVVFESVLMRVKLISLRSRGENGNTSVALPKNWNHANVKIYCFATSKNGKSISPSQYLTVE